MFIKKCLMIQHVLNNFSIESPIQTQIAHTIFSRLGTRSQNLKFKQQKDTYFEHLKKMLS